VLFNFFNGLADKGSFSDFVRKGKGIGASFGGTFDTADDIDSGDVVGEDTGGCKGTSCDGSQVSSIGKGSMSGGNWDTSMDWAGISVSGRNNNLGTSGHENNGKDNELIHGDVELCAMALNEL
jgi:hypothetical protein